MKAKRLYAAFLTLLLTLSISAQHYSQRVTVDNVFSYGLNSGTGLARFLGVTDDGISELVIPQSVSFEGVEYTVTEVSSEDVSEAGAAGILSIEIPASVIVVSQGFLDVYPALENVVCLAAVPPLVSEDAKVLYISEDTVPVRTLYVPAYAVEAYRSSPSWGGVFKEYKALEELPASALLHGGFTVSSAAFPSDITVREETYVPDNDYSYYPAGHVDVNASGTVSANTFSIGYSRYLDDVNLYEFPDTCFDGTLIVNSPMRAGAVSTSLTLRNNAWSFVSFPFDVKLSELQMPDSADIVIYKYSGADRAVSNYKSTWQEMTVDSTLKAYQGYIMQSREYYTTSSEEDGEVYYDTDNRPYTRFVFKASGSATRNNVFTAANVSIPLTEHLSEFPQNRSWNLIGNPYPSCFDMSSTDLTSTYIVWNPESQTYTAVSPADDRYVLLPGEAFFLQKPVDMAAVTFRKEGRQHDRKTTVSASSSRRAIGRRSEDAATQRVLIDLTLSDGSHSDRTRMVVNPQAASAYEIGTDAVKFRSNDSSVPQLFSLEEGIEMAINERPLTGGSFRLAFSAPSQGTYTIALSRLSSYAEVTLTDALTGVSTVLNTSSYTFNAQAGEDLSRFQITVGSIGGHGNFDPELPDDPGSNSWSMSDGSLIIDKYEPGTLSDVVDAIISDYAVSIDSEALQMLRNRVLQLIVGGKMDIDDVSVYQNLPSCRVLDLSRTTGWNRLETGAFTDTLPQTIMLPACIDTVCSYAFSDYSGISELYLYSVVPPVVEGEPFDSLPQSLTLYVPAVAYPAYSAHPYWGQLMVQPFSDQVCSMSVNLPADAIDGRYRNMTLQVYNCDYGQSQSYLVGDRTLYTFNNLLKNCTYKVLLKNSYNIAISVKSDIKVGQEDVIVDLTDILESHNVSVKVLTPDGEDITTSCLVTWTNSQGELVRHASKLSGVTSGTELHYAVALPESAAVGYLLPSDNTVVVADADVNVECKLTAIPKVTISGHVTAAASGRALQGASVSVAQTYNGKYGRSFTTATAADGSFTMSVPAISSVLTVLSDGYVASRSDLTLTSDKTLDIALDTITGATLQLSLKYIATHSEDADPDTLNDFSAKDQIVYSFYNNTKDCPVENISVQYPYIVLIDSVSPGDNITISASIADGSFAPVEDSFDVDDNLSASYELLLYEPGAVQASFTWNAIYPVYLMAYSDEGLQTVVGTVSTGNSHILRNMSDGNYTVVAMASTSNMSGLKNLQQFGSMNLVDGQDYVSQQVYVESGIISQVSFDSIPAFDLSRHSYLDSSSRFTSDKVLIADGGYMTLTADVFFRADVMQGVSDIELLVDLPAGCEYMEGSAMTGRTLSDAYVREGVLHIPFTADVTQIRFCIRPTLSGTVEPSAQVAFAVDGHQETSLLGSVQVEVKGVSLSAPLVTPVAEVSLSGTAPGSSMVYIYDGDVLIGSVSANMAGMWTTTCTLHGTGTEVSNHTLRAKVVTAGDEVINTESVTCRHDPDAIIPLGVRMSVPNTSSSYVEYIYFDFQKNKTYSYVSNETSQDTTGVTGPSIGRFVEGASYTLDSQESHCFEFQIVFTDCDDGALSDVALICLMEDNTTVTLPAVKVAPSIWKTSRYFSDDNLVIGVAGVNYYTHRDPSVFDSSLLVQYADSLNRIREDYIQGKARVHDLYDQLQAELSKDNPDEALVARLQEEFRAAVMDGLEPTDSLDLTEEQRQFIEGLDHSDPASVYRLVDMPGSDITREIIDYLMDLEDITMPAKASYSFILQEGGPTYSISWDLKSIPADGGFYFPQTLFSTHFSEDGTQMIFSNTQGDVIIIDLVDTSASQVRPRSGYVKDSKDNDTSDNNSGNNNSGNNNSGNNNSGNAGLEQLKADLTDMLTNEVFSSALDHAQDFATMMADLASTPGAAEAFKDLAAAAKFVDDFSNVLGAATEFATALEAGTRENASQFQNMMYQGFPVQHTDAFNTASMAASSLANWNAGVMVGHSVLGAIALVGVIAAPLTGGLSLALSLSCTAVGLTLNYWDKEVQASANDLYNQMSAIQGNRLNVKPVRDPSGFVCEAVESNRLEGVTAVLYYQQTVTDEFGDEHLVVDIWDAASYAQQNPQFTQADGRYNWDVPAGLWQVRFHKDGYEDISTEWLPVPPPQLDVNVAMTSYEEPFVSSVNAYRTGVDISFSKYMKSQMLTADNIMVTADGVRLPGYIEFHDEEGGFDSDENYTSSLRWYPESEDVLQTGTEVVIMVSHTVQSYAGVAMSSDFAQTFPVMAEIESIDYPSDVEVKQGADVTFSITLMPLDAAVGDTVFVTDVLGSGLVSPQSMYGVADEEGVVSFTLSGVAQGTAELNFTVSGPEQAGGVITVHVLSPALFPDAPVASVASGSAVEEGTEVALTVSSDTIEIYCSTDGEDFWYYDAPIVIDAETTSIWAYAVNGDGRSSDVVRFTYTVVATAVGTVSESQGDPADIYDLGGRRVEEGQGKGIYIKGRRKVLRR